MLSRPLPRMMRPIRFTDRWILSRFESAFPGRGFPAGLSRRENAALLNRGAFAEVTN